MRAYDYLGPPTHEPVSVRLKAKSTRPVAGTRQGDCYPVC